MEEARGGGKAVEEEEEKGGSFLAGEAFWGVNVLHNLSPKLCWSFGVETHH